MTSIQPMNASVAIETAKQIFLLLRDVVARNEAEYIDIFVQAVAPELIGAARMENLASQEIATSHECSPDVLVALRSRYGGRAPTAPAELPEA